MTERDTSKTSYRHVLKYTGLFGSVQGLTILLSLVRNKIASLLLGAEGLGLTSLFNSSIKMVGDATSLGLPVSAVKHVAACFEQGDETALRRAVMLVRLWSLMAAVLGSALCLACSAWLNSITFTWGNHRRHFMLLSVAVFMSAVTAGEVAILKGTRRLGQIARVSVYCVALSIAVTTPIYYLYGQSGIVPSLILIALLQMLLTMAFSYHCHPLRQSISRQLLGEGLQMVRLGLVFVVAGVLGSITDFLIRRYFSYYADLQVAGLYSSCYTLVMTYGGMVFSSMDSDYFPRLSSISHIGRELYLAISRQTEVGLLLVGPMVVMLIVAMPVVVPLLFRSDFIAIVGMAQLASVYLVLRALCLPMEYVSLSRGDAPTFFLQELFSCLMLLLGVLAGYRLAGLTGSGIGITLGMAAETLFVAACSRLKYGYRIPRRVLACTALMLSAALAALAVASLLYGWTYWCAGAALAAATTAVSWKILRADVK